MARREETRTRRYLGLVAAEALLFLVPAQGPPQPLQVFPQGDPLMEGEGRVQRGHGEEQEQLLLRAEAQALGGGEAGLPVFSSSVHHHHHLFLLLGPLLLGSARRGPPRRAALQDGVHLGQEAVEAPGGLPVLGAQQGQVDDELGAHGRVAEVAELPGVAQPVGLRLRVAEAVVVLAGQVFQAGAQEPQLQRVTQVQQPHHELQPLRRAQH